MKCPLCGDELDPLELAEAHADGDPWADWCEPCAEFLAATATVQIAKEQEVQR